MKPNIIEIQRMANDSDVKVSTLLREAKIVASNLNQNDFISWLDKELNGYSKDDKVPEYRVIKGIPQGHNPYRGWIPYFNNDPKSQEIISSRGIGQSVGQLEEILKSDKGSLAVKYPPDVEAQLRKSIRYDIDIQLSIDRAAVVGIIEHVRNIILDWSINLKKAGVPDEPSEFSAKDVADAKEVKPRYQIQHIENFTGNIGESSNFKSVSGQLVPQETFWVKFFWYVGVALVVVVAGNIISALILRKVFGM